MYVIRRLILRLLINHFERKATKARAIASYYSVLYADCPGSIGHEKFLVYGKLEQVCSEIVERLKREV